MLDQAERFGEDHGKTRLLLYIHGGLNKIGSARKKAKADTSLIEGAGYYPIFIGWRSGAFSTYWEHLTRICQGRRTGNIRGLLTAPVYLLMDVGHGVTQGPALLIRRVYNFARHRADENNVNVLFRELRSRFETSLDGGEPALGISREREGKRSLYRSATSLLVAILKWIPLMVIDGTGSAAWGNMLRRTKPMFRRPDEFDLGRRRTEPSVGPAPEPRGVVVEAGRKEAILDVQLRVIYGFNIPELVINVRQNVAIQVLELCGMVAKEINIVVSGIDFSGRVPGRVQ